MAMRVTECGGYLVEVMDPAYTAGVLVAWVSSPRPERRIMGTGRGDTPVAACVAAVEDWLSTPERLTSGQERIGRAIMAELLKPTGRPVVA
jgi:hypothetical protein